MTKKRKTSGGDWMQDPHVRLMLQVRDDVAGAFEQLVDAYRDRAVGLLFHLVGDVHDAEELAQEAFVRIFRNRKKYEPTAKFSTWFFTIVNNLALNAIRDRRRRPASELPASESGPMAGRPLEQIAMAPSGSMPSRVFAKAEMAEIVRAAVAQLSEEQRIAVILNKFEEMNYRQIAQIMNKSEMAIKSLLARARATLRELLEPYLGNGRK